MMTSIRRRTFIAKLVGIYAICKVGITQAIAASDLYIPGFLINVYLKTQFPISKDWFVVKADFSNPNLAFIPGSQRLALATNLKVALMGSSPFEGKMLCSSSFTYDENAKTLKLKSPTIDRLDFQQLGDKEKAALQQINSLISKLFDGFTVYEFKPNERSLLSSPPKQILVEESGIRLIFN